MRCFSEMEILREEISSLQTVKSKLQEKVKDQEVDIKKMREELEKKNNSTKDEEEVLKYILSFLGILGEVYMEDFLFIDFISNL